MKYYFLQDNHGYLQTSPLTSDEANEMARENWTLRFEDFDGTEDQAVSAAQRFNCEVKMRMVGGDCQCGQH